MDFVSVDLRETIGVMLHDPSVSARVCAWNLRYEEQVQSDRQARYESDLNGAIGFSTWNQKHEKLHIQGRIYLPDRNLVQDTFLAINNRAHILDLEPNQWL